MKEAMDEVWALTERLESIERTLAATQKYLKQAREDLQEAAREADRAHGWGKDKRGAA